MTRGIDTLHELVPRDRRRNLLYRRNLLDRCQSSAAARDLVTEACRRDCLFWINSWVLQYNPKSIGSGSPLVGPFVTWECQEPAVERILWCVENQRDLVIEKSRDMGASWLCLLVMDWLFLFHKWQKLHCISRHEHAVYKPGDSDSLFWKLNFVHDHLPAWMAGDHVKRTKLVYVNSRTNSSITGEASTGKAGVGGRATMMFIDEFGQIREDYEVYGRTSDTTACRVFNSTHTGTGSAFFDILYGKLAAGASYEHLRMHWTDHPDKRRGLYKVEPKSRRPDPLDAAYDYGPDFHFVRDAGPTGGPHPYVRSPWYDDQCRRKGSPRQVAIDLDIDPRGASSQFFDPMVVADLKREFAKDPEWVGDIDYDKDAGRPIGLVAAPGGPLKLWLTPGFDGRPPRDVYGAGCDLSTGSGVTPTCMTFVNARGEKVAEYTNAFIGPVNFAACAVALCRLFCAHDGRGARMAWEAQGPGGPFTDRVMDLGYFHVYYQTDQFSLSKKQSDRPGFHSSPQSKRLLLENYRTALQTRAFVNRSEAALDETLLFVYDGRSVANGRESAGDDPSGAGLNHGDHVIADALAWMMVKADAAPPPARPRPDLIRRNTLAYRRKVHEDRLEQLDNPWDQR